MKIWAAMVGLGVFLKTFWGMLKNGLKERDEALLRAQEAALAQDLKGIHADYDAKVASTPRDWTDAELHEARNRNTASPGPDKV